MDRPVTFGELEVMANRLVREIQECVGGLRADIQGIRDDVRAINCRAVAIAENAARKKYNAAACLLASDAKLSPLLDIHTGNEIAGFPVTLRALLELDVTTAKRIIEALGMSVVGSDVVMLREKVREATL